MLRSRLIPAAMMLALLAGACAQDVGDINRVQPNYVKKDIFDGIWYFRQTVTEVPYEQGALFEGIEGDLDKIRWEITENSLIAYRSYEFIPGANTPRADGAKYDGQPIAAWGIESHFDIARGYNPATGEVNNVISENTSDRPWWERDYMRVNWATNLIPNTNGIDFMLQFDSASPADYYIPETELDNPDRAEITPTAINIVNKYNLMPDEYSCYLEFNDWWSYNYNCGPTTVKMRSSFLRIDPARAPYEPLDYPNHQELKGEDGQSFRTITLCTATNGRGQCVDQAEFACTEDFISVVRDAFDDISLTARDVCDTNKIDYFVKFGFFRTERITYDRLYGHTETGRIFRANRWNIWKNAVDSAGRPVPYAQRQPKPITYHLNVNFPDAVKPAAYEVAEEWNKAFQETVAALTGSPATTDMFVLKENTCSMNGIRTFVAKNGLENAVKAVTGERGLEGVHAANLPRVCASLESASGGRFTWEKTGDLRYSFLYWVNQPQISGPLGFGPSAADPETGEIVSGDAYIYGAALDTYAQSATDMVLALNGDLDEDTIISGDHIRALVAENRANRRDMERISLGEDTRAFLKDRVRRGGETREERLERISHASPGWRDARLARLGDDVVREKLIGEQELYLARGYRPDAALTEDVLKQASPKHWASSRLRSESRARMQKYLKKCVYWAAFADDSIAGLALQYKAEGKTRQQIWEDIRNQVFKAVALHEVGHTVGLRHNFEGSSDALNYFDEFWEIQESESDPQKRIERRQPEYKYSTIMDYGAKFNSDIMGLGKYDHAAIRFGYGQLVDVWDEGMQSVDHGTLDFLSRAVFDYTQLPQVFQGKDNMKRRNAVRFDQVTDDFKRGLLANTEVALANRNTLASINSESPRANARVNVAYTRPNEVPYRFCTDEQESYSDTCRVWDEGGNSLEQTASLVEMYKNYYIFSAFKRDRFNFDPNAYLDRLYGRYFRRFVETFQNWYFYGEYYDWIAQNYFGQESAPAKSMEAATLLGLNTLAQVFQTPEPGWYCKDGGEYVLVDETNGCEPDTEFEVPLGTGRSYWSEFTDDDIHWQFSTAGGYYERLAALLALTDSDANIAAADSFEDSRRFSLSFYRTFKEELVSLFGGLITGDIEPISGVVVNDRFVPRPLIEMPGMPKPPATAPALLPETSYNLRLYAIYFGMALFTNTLDDQMDFTRYTKIALKGSNEDIYRPEGVPVVEVTDPFTKYTYVAAQTADGVSIGHRMVEQTKALVDDYNTQKAALDAMPENPTNPAYLQQKSRVNRLRTRVSSQIELMDDMRLFGGAFQFGG